MVVVEVSGRRQSVPRRKGTRGLLSERAGHPREGKTPGVREHGFVPELRARSGQQLECRRVPTKGTPAAVVELTPMSVRQLI